jgi:ferredoxin-NADP reductase/nitrite reductase/ring-hydroxylating ferredoxin subunit
MSEHRLALKEKDMQENKPVRIDVKNKPIVLTKVSNKVYAMDAICSHEGGPLEDGNVEGYNLTCPWHYAVFDIRNAKVSDQTVWATDLSSYPIKIEQSTGNILIDLEPSLASKEKEKEEEEAQQQSTTESINIVESETKEHENKEKTDNNEFELTLLEKREHQDTDVMSFKFGKQDNISHDIFNYAAGQYAFFDIGGVYNDPKGPVRHFSLASSPTEEEIIISTRIRDTPYKKRLSSLEIGSTVKVSKPLGKFVLHDDYSKPAVLLSGGIGVTPFRSMIKYATDKQLPLSIVMFDSNRNISNTLYKEEFDECLNKNKSLKVVYTITEKEDDDNQSSSAIGVNKEWKGERGRIDKAILTKHINDYEVRNSIFYICGPPGMVNAMKELLNEDLQIPEDRIRIEEFTGY